jgi:hypothetical protein
VGSTAGLIGAATLWESKNQARPAIPNETAAKSPALAELSAIADPWRSFLAESAPAMVAADMTG